MDWAICSAIRAKRSSKMVKIGFLYRMAVLLSERFGFYEASGFCSELNEARFYKAALNLAFVAIRFA